MEAVDLARFYSGGYFLIRSGNPGWDQHETELLPDERLSLSSHITPHFNLAWGWSTGDKEIALKFGVREELWDDFADWCQHDFSEVMDLWGIFYSPEGASSIAYRFLSELDNLHVIGVGLPLDLEERNWREPIVDEKELYGIDRRIEQHLAIEAGGQPLGFEVASSSYGSFGCSWLCNYLHVDMNELFGIRPGKFGLIQNESEAKQVYDWIAEDEMKGQRAEPEPYDYWLLVEYPLVLGQKG